LTSIRNSNDDCQASVTNSGSLEITVSESISKERESALEQIELKSRAAWFEVCSDGSRKIADEIKALREYVSTGDADPSLVNSLIQAEMAMNCLSEDLAKRKIAYSGRGSTRRRIKIPDNWIQGYRIDVELDGVKYRGSVPPSGCRPGDIVEFDFVLGAIRIPSLTFQD
jgi:hypothetical protein